LHPDLGKANTPYARTVAPKTMQPGALPDAGDIFDSLMTRTHTDKHPNKISVILFYLASIIIHDLFRTDHSNFYNSQTSSYLDLAPLYGSNIDEQNVMRTHKDGKIKPDAFSEIRLLSFPPGVGILLIMFNRFHNNTVEMLARVNQGNQFRRPKGDWPTLSWDDKNYPADWKTYDESLFQTGRLITCGLYVNIILGDYVKTILNLNKTNSNWVLDPRVDIPGVPVAAGNQVSAEFNLVYRWHSAISVRDEKWTNALWKAEFSDLNPKTVTYHQFITAASKMEAKFLAMDPTERPLGQFKRTNGKFDEDALVEELANSIEDCSNAYGANRVPPVMRVIEVLGIEQARAWNVASLNEFRKYFGLEPHKTFESINPDPYVADQLKRLYDHPDYVELYPGLVTEEPKQPMVPGAGLTPSFTISRAVLSDAVALVRGDRFYTVDYHPKKLTNWGFAEASTDNAIDHGCIMYKLILTAFPFHFKPDSIYAHYPLTIPEEMTSVIKTLGRADHYSYTRPTRGPAIKVISSYGGVEAVLKSPETFKTAGTDSFIQLLGAQAKYFTAAGDGAKNSKSREAIEKALYVDGKWEAQVREYYEMITEKLLKEKAYKIADKNQVDIIRDIGNLTHIHFVSEMFALPLKTKERPLGVFTEHELYIIMVTIYLTVFFDIDPISSYPIRQKTRDATQMLGSLVEANIREIAVGGVFNRLMTAIFPAHTPLKDYGINLIKRFLKSGLEVPELVWGHILSTLGGLTANQGQLFAQVLEYYLTVGHDAHWAKINALAKDNSDKSFEVLRRYIMEGVRIAGQTGIYREVAKSCELKDGDKNIKLAAGEKVLLNLHAASLDPKIFPNPEQVVLDRPESSYIALGLGTHECLGSGMTYTALTAMFKVIGKFDNLRPVLGQQGVLHKIKAVSPNEGIIPTGPWYDLYLTENHDRLWPFPQSKLSTNCFNMKITDFWHSHESELVIKWRESATLEGFNGHSNGAPFFTITAVSR
jgi:linoleate 8R-lipoxygenase / 9,12-octadecadienoate 8-hydroperoxide 8R-isomerase